VLIRLSAAGRRRFADALPTALEYYRRVLRGVPAAEFKTLMRLLRRIKVNVRMMSDAATLDSE
jgi:hypothetical protein